MENNKKYEELLGEIGGLLEHGASAEDITIAVLRIVQDMDNVPLYTRNKTEKLCRDAYNEGYAKCAFHEGYGGSESLSEDDWIKQNLK